MNKVIIIFIILWGIATNPGLMECFIVTVALLVLYAVYVFYDVRFDPKAVTANKGADPARGIKPEPPTTKFETRRLRAFFSQLIVFLILAWWMSAWSLASAPDISIHDAAAKGNIEAVKQHIAAGSDVNAKDRDGETPLDRAALFGHKEVAELLIAKGVDVNADHTYRLIMFLSLVPMFLLIYAAGRSELSNNTGGFWCAVVGGVLLMSVVLLLGLAECVYRLIVWHGLKEPFVTESIFRAWNN